MGKFWTDQKNLYNTERLNLWKEINACIQVDDKMSNDAPNVIQYKIDEKYTRYKSTIASSPYPIQTFMYRKKPVFTKASST